MAKSFTELTKQEQKELLDKMAAVLEEHDMRTTPIDIYREEVCALKGNSVDGRTAVSIEKDFPSTEQEKVDKFNAAMKTVIEGVSGVEVNVKAKLGPGDNYKTITGITTIEDPDTKVDLEHKQGEVWLIDFWATWCPPCQAPMAHNQEMLEKRAAEWGDKVKIIGISIDQDAKTVVDHVKAKKWESVIHYHRAGSDCSKVYEVNGVPHVMLIDQNGKIAFKGHPARRELEKDLDTLLKGESLTGEGVGPAQQAEDQEEEEDKDFKDLDSDQVAEEMDKFKELGASLQKDEDLKAAVEKFPRAFCVMVHSQKYKPSARRMVGKFQNFRVLVGPKADIEKVKGILDEKVKGSFEVVLREHPIDA